MVVYTNLWGTGEMPNIEEGTGKLAALYYIAVFFSLWFQQYIVRKYRSKIQDHTISLRFLGIISRVLRLEVSVWIS
jgi:hypothetical protein